MAAEEFGTEEEFALEEEEVSFDFEDEFDRLRQKTSRTSAVYDEMDLEDDLVDEEPQGFLAQITPVQRLILLVLLLLDVVVIAIGTMAVFNLI
jgi:hypothetical protein